MGKQLSGQRAQQVRRLAQVRDFKKGPKARVPGHTEGGERGGDGGGREGVEGLNCVELGNSRLEFRFHPKTYGKPLWRLRKGNDRRRALRTVPLVWSR